MATIEADEVDTLTAKLRESRLSTDERRTALDTLRTAWETSDTATLFISARTAIRDGPNDVRRIAFQSLSTHFESPSASDATNGSWQASVAEIIEVTEMFLKTTLKVQSSSPFTASARSSLDISTLSTSSLRAIATALKTLHTLIRIAPARRKTATQPKDVSGGSSDLISLFDIVLPCLSAGLQVRRSMPRSSSSLQAGAFSWSGHTRLPRSASTNSDRNAIGPSPSNAALSNSNKTGSTHIDPPPDYSSSGETDRKSDQSESERSDFSAASTANRSRRDESRQQETVSKLVRQNALHCLIELNTRHCRWLVSRWNVLLPDQPAPTPSSVTLPQSSATPRFTASAEEAFSLCTLITRDPSTSVRVAAMSALESILSHGAAQLSMAQERAQRALSFTSLSSQLASWIVNIRSYLVLALQRAATAPRASAGAEAVGYPSMLSVALLQLTGTFVTSTAKARLVTSNADVLGASVLPFASHGDPQIQAGARALLAVLTPSSQPVSATASTRGVRSGRRSIAVPTDCSPAFESPAEPQTKAQSDPSQKDILALLGQNPNPPKESYQRVLAALEADDSTHQLPAWCVFVKTLADASTPSLDSDTSTRLFALWRRITQQPGRSSDQECALLGSVADLHRALSRCGALDAEMPTSILGYVERRCDWSDEAIRAAAVRVLGLLVLPSDGEVDRDDEDHHRIAAVLDGVLWGNAGGKNDGMLHDSSSLVRQRASWAFSNAMEARLRLHTPLDEQSWTTYARYCLDAVTDIEGVAVSAYRASGSLLAMLSPSSSTEASSLGRSLLQQLCRVLNTTSKPPKSRWNAASALERALGSDVVLLRCEEGLVDKVTESLCSSLSAKVFKIRASAANALVALCLTNSDRMEVLGERRRRKVRGAAMAGLTELGERGGSKEVALYGDELRRLLNRLIASIPAPA